MSSPCSSTCDTAAAPPTVSTTTPGSAVASTSATGTLTSSPGASRIVSVAGAASPPGITVMVAWMSVCAEAGDDDGLVGVAVGRRGPLRAVPRARGHVGRGHARPSHVAARAADVDDELASDDSRCCATTAATTATTTTNRIGPRRTLPGTPARGLRRHLGSRFGSQWRREWGRRCSHPLPPERLVVELGQRVGLRVPLRAAGATRPHGRTGHAGPGCGATARPPAARCTSAPAEHRPAHPLRLVGDRDRAARRSTTYPLAHPNDRWWRNASPSRWPSTPSRRPRPRTRCPRPWRSTTSGTARVRSVVERGAVRPRRVDRAAPAAAPRREPARTRGSRRARGRALDRSRARSSCCAIARRSATGASPQRRRLAPACSARRRSARPSARASDRAGWCVPAAASTERAVDHVVGVVLGRAPLLGDVTGAVAGEHVAGAVAQHDRIERQLGGVARPRACGTRPWR